jgi:tryptophanyl-tRNA synthetase
MLPFIFNKYLQDAFKVPFVIQVTDDEKYFFKEGGDISEFTKLAYENIKDILALGFDPERTFIFIDTEYIGHMYTNVVKFQKYINLNTLKAIFGLNFSDNCGKASYPAIQAAPCLSSSFPHIFGKKNIPCIIPCGIDQDPYFRMTRDVCARIGAPKPASFYSKYFHCDVGFSRLCKASRPRCQPPYLRQASL